MKKSRYRLTLFVMVLGVLGASTQINYTYWYELAPVYLKNLLFLSDNTSDGLNLPPLPNPYINAKTLRGVDVDQNGIRDVSDPPSQANFLS